MSAPLAATPPLGWNSWNMFGSAVDEQCIRETADALVASGLKDCGYEYVVIDDCWSERSSRDPHGDLVPDPVRFPNGIKALADHVHAQGLKLGIYSDAAERTCAGYPGSLGFEAQDAKLWASWELDFLKYDYCNAPCDQAAAIERYTRMGEALRNSGRRFLYSLCEWGDRYPHLWGRQVDGHMWRVSGDIFDCWSNRGAPPEKAYGQGIEAAFDIAAAVHEYGGPGGWNDLDMLVVGLAGGGQVPGKGMSLIEYQTQLSMWCMACSPLMIGCDVRKLDAQSASLLMNREVLAVNQDALGKPAARVQQRGDCDVWKKPLSDGAVAVALVNRGSSAEEITVKAGEVGLLDEPKIARDLWTQQDIADFKETFRQRLEPHQTVLLRVAG